MYESTWFDEQRPQGGIRAFITLSAGLLAGGAFLYLTAGPPRPPTEIPSWDNVIRTLSGSDLPPEVIGYLLTTLAWAIWFWIVGSIGLRMVALAGEAKAHGSKWARRLRALSDRVTLPVIRRVVDAALFAVVMFNVASRPAPIVAAAPLTVTVEARQPDRGKPFVTEAAETTGSIPSPYGGSRYTVRDGDTLWTISEYFYGTGFEYMRLVEANAGREMPDGRRFPRTGVIHPGWVLVVPSASRAVEDLDGQSVYTVQKCDTLSGIAARLLGDESRWPEIFELNKRSARMPDGRELTNADLIWPGLRLRLPTVGPEAATERHGDPSETELPSESTAPIDEPGPADDTVAESPIAEDADVGAPEPETSTSSPPVQRRPTVIAEPPRSPSTGLPSELIVGAAATAVSAAVGGGIYLARRRFRRSLREPPVSRADLGYENEEGFAEGDAARVFVHRVHGAEVEPVARIAGETLDLLRSEGISDVRLVTAHQDRGSVGLTLEARMSAQERIADLMPAIHSRLGAASEVRPTPDHDVLVHLTAVRLADFMVPPTTLHGQVPLLLPIGLLQRREPLYANWGAMENVLVAGATGVGTEAVLTGLVASLVARCHPRDLQLWTIADRGTVAPQILELPHQQRVCTALHDAESVANVLGEIRHELERRLLENQTDSEATTPDLVLVIGEFADLLDDSTPLDVILRDGPTCGIRVLAATTRLETLDPDLTAEFNTRMLLHVDDDEHSIQLLGRPDAADLGADGDLLLRISGRSPVLLRGFRVAPEHLDQLVDLMGNAYGGGGGSLLSPAASGGEQSDPGPTDARAATPGASGSQASPAPDQRAPEHGRLNEASVGSGRSPSGDDQDQPALNTEGGGEGTEHHLAGSNSAGERLIDLEASHPAQTQLQSAAQPGLLATLQERRAKSLVQVRCFGVLQVTSGDRELTPEGKDGPRHKAWEILACLAAHPARGVPKEKLLTMLWPGVGSESATSRLYSNLSILRALLAEQVPGLPADAVRGDKSSGMYRLDSSLVWSDVQEFLTLIQGARKLSPAERQLAYEQARSLYRGDLLTDMPYKWINAEDERGYTLWEAYREEYRQLTCRLAQLYSADGQPERAVLLYRDLLRDEPTLEDVVRQLFRCYQQLGDRTSLIRDERLLREAIRQRYSDPDDPDHDPSFYEPEPETIKVYREVLSELDAKKANAEGRPAAPNAPATPDRRV